MFEKDGQVEGLGGLVQVEGKDEKMYKRLPFEVDGQKSFQTAANKQKPKQERKWIRKEAKGSQCAGKRGGDRATSNVQ